MGATRPGWAAGAAVTGMATLGITDNTVPFISAEGSLWQFHAFRSAFGLVVLIALALAAGWRLWPHRAGAVAARTVFPATAMVVYFGCVGVMPITVVVAGFFTAPLWVLLITAFVQRRPVGPTRWAAVALGFAGVLTVMGAGGELLTWGGWLAFPVLAGLLYGISGVTTRAWCEGESTLTLTLWFFAYLGVIGAVGMAVVPMLGLTAPEGALGFVTRGAGPVDSDFLFWTVIQGIGSIIGIGCIFQGYLWGEASRVVIFEYSFLVFASLGALWIWSDPITPQEMTGMAMVIVAGVMIALKEQT